MSWLPLRLLTCKKFGYEKTKGGTQVFTNHALRPSNWRDILSIPVSRLLLDRSRGALLIRGKRPLPDLRQLTSQSESLRSLNSLRLEGEPALHYPGRPWILDRLLIDLLIYTTNEHGVKTFFLVMIRIHNGHPNL